MADLHVGNGPIYCGAGYAPQQRWIQQRPSIEALSKPPESTISKIFFS